MAAFLPTLWPSGSVSDITAKASRGLPGAADAKAAPRCRHCEAVMASGRGRRSGSPRGGAGRQRFEGDLRDDQGGRRRPSRVSGLVLRELSQIIREHVANSPRSAGLGSALISVMDVSVSKDLRNATVKVSVFKTQDQRANAMDYLKKNRKTFRTLLAQRLSYMKTVPELRFEEADVEGAFRTLEIINSLNISRTPSAADTDDTEHDANVFDDDDDVILDENDDSDFDEDDNRSKNS